MGVDNLVLPNDKLKQKAYETWRTSGLGGLSGPEAALASRLATAQRLSSTEAGYSSPTEGHTHTESDGASMTIPRPWRLGELEFEAMMRHLDNAGCRTGHLYRQVNIHLTVILYFRITNSNLVSLIVSVLCEVTFCRTGSKGYTMPLRFND